MNAIKNIGVAASGKSETQNEKAAKLVFNWNDCVAESRKEYVGRIRKRRLLNVMRSVMMNELDPNQRALLKLKHFENKSNYEIADELFMSESAVRRNAKKAEDIIASYMKYVIAFADADIMKEDKPLDVKMAIARLFLENATQDKISARLRRVRSERFISVRQAALCTGITEERLLNIEETGGADVGELKRLLAFYGVSADYIIFGAE